MKIAVAGATGRVGRPVVDILGAQGHDVVPMSRSGGVDVVTGQGLERALEGVGCVIDATSGASSQEGPAREFFEASARNLHESGDKTCLARIVVVSIIGADRFKAGYMAAKAAHERAIVTGPIPVGILRAAQFHEFVGQLIDWGKNGEVSYVPAWRTQLVAAGTVAQALANLATGPAAALAPGPAGAAIPEIAGPRAENLADAAARFAARRGDPVKIEGVSDAADPDRDLYEDGALLPGPGAILAGPSFEEWLDSQP